MRVWMKELREKLGMSQQNVAEKIGVRQSYYGMIESGERQKDLNLSMAVKLGEIFNVTVDYIIEQERGDLYAERAGGDA